MIEEEKHIPTISIGVVGHVDHGKTTLVQALTGIWTAHYSEELKKSMTIYLGYAQTSIFRCSNTEPPDSYITSSGSCREGSQSEYIKTVSFVDAPGHEILMTTMLSGASLMDAAIVVVAANEPCPQPQTREHVKALEILGINQVVVVQNKVDVISREKVLESYKQIKQFLENTPYSKSPIIPVSALHKANIGAVAMAIAKLFKEPERVLGKPAIMQIARSFDVNLPGTRPEKLVGGVLGGGVIRGEIRVGDDVEIKPGVRIEAKGKVRYEPLTTEVISIRYADVESDVARPGGLVAIGTKLDPSLTKGNRLAGQVLGHDVPDPVNDVLIEYRMLDKIVGARELEAPPPLKPGEKIIIIIGTANTTAVVQRITSDEMEVKTDSPIVAFEKSKVALLAKIKGRWRLIGWGNVK